MSLSSQSILQGLGCMLGVAVSLVIPIYALIILLVVLVSARDYTESMSINKGVRVEVVCRFRQTLKDIIMYSVAIICTHAVVTTFALPVLPLNGITVSLAHVVGFWIASHELRLIIQFVSEYTDNDLLTKLNDFLKRNKIGTEAPKKQKDTKEEKSEEK